MVSLGTPLSPSATGMELRLFGEPEIFTRRRMGVALARAEDVDTARATARAAAGRVRPRA